MNDSTSGGVPGLGDKAWGRHFCHFYQNGKDLEATLVPFFKSGLEGVEACRWVTSGLRTAVPDLEQRERAGQLEIIDHPEWYRRHDESSSTLQGWLDREQETLQQGFAGLRLTGDTHWLERDDLPSFVAYEEQPIRVRDAAAEDLRRLQSHDVTLIETIPQMVWTADGTGAAEYFNQQWCQFTGMSVANSVGEGWLRAVHSEDRGALAMAWAASVRHGRTLEAECRQRGCESGEYRWFLVRAEPLRGRDGSIVRWFGTCTDIELQKRAETSLRDNDRRKDEFLATLGHELRNPLAPILTAVQLIDLRDGGREYRRELDVIGRQIRHLAALVDDLLDVSRITRGDVELRRQPIEIATVVAHGIELSGPLLQQRRQLVTTRVPSSGLAVHADPNRLSQVIVNLLNNAARYTAVGGRITVDAEARGGEVILRVADTGQGIAAELLDRMFELFVKGERQLTRTDGGRGLGLAIVRGLVELHGGTVTVKSTVGVGSEFTVRLPRIAQRSDSESRPISCVAVPRVLS